MSRFSLSFLSSLGLLLLAAPATLHAQTSPSPATPDGSFAKTMPASAATPASSATPPPASNDQPIAQSLDATETDTLGKPTGKIRPDSKADQYPVPPNEIHNPTLWHNPGNIAALNLYYGQGGPSGMPVPPFTFESEDMNGSNPKFNAHDGAGHKWRVKLGNEAQPEVVASRLLWAMGYYVNDDYVLPSATIAGIHMKRGDKLIHDGVITDARFERKPDHGKKIGIWEWRNNPFIGTREFNGLRVMMAVMNGWDLKDINNAVYTEKGSDKEYFLCSDIGATFATTDFSLTKGRSKGNLDEYMKSKFIIHETPTTVSFATPSAPTGLMLITFGAEAPDFAMRKSLEWIGRDIPRADARWMGQMLGQLSHQQLVDAFRAGHFPPAVVDQFVMIVQNRIALLQGL